jgi:tetratricopeptide (TPR) repeat protein
MKKYLNIRVWFILWIGWLPHLILAQVDKYMEAMECYQKKDFACAKNKIDEVVIHPDTKDEPAAWTLKAYVYFQLFKNQEVNNRYSKYRQESIKSLEKSESLSPDPDVKEQNKKLLKIIAETFYNQIKVFLYDSLNYNACLELYNNYKSIYKTYDPNVDFKNKDIEFHLSVGGQFVSTMKQILDSSKDVDESKFKKYTEVAKVSFNKVLELDPNNVSALEGLAITYYNQGAHIIKTMSFDIPFEEIYQMQDKSVQYFKQALPYMQKAYELKPNDPGIIEGLAGIYWALNEYEKHKEYMKKLEKLKKEEK